MELAIAITITIVIAYNTVDATDIALAINEKWFAPTDQLLVPLPSKLPPPLHRQLVQFRCIIFIIVIATAISSVIIANIAMTTAKYHDDLYSPPTDRPIDQRAEYYVIYNCTPSSSSHHISSIDWGNIIPSTNQISITPTYHTIIHRILIAILWYNTIVFVRLTR